MYTKISKYAEWIRKQIDNSLQVQTKFQQMDTSNFTENKHLNKNVNQMKNLHFNSKTIVENKQSFQNQNNHKDLTNENLNESKLIKTVSNLTEFSISSTNFANIVSKFKNTYYYFANYFFVNIFCVLIIVSIFSFACFLSKKRILKYRKKYILKKGYSRNKKF